MASVIYIIEAVFFFIFASGKEQEWNRFKEDDVETNNIEITKF